MASQLEQICVNIQSLLETAFNLEYTEIPPLITRDTALSFEEAANINAPVVFIGRGEMSAKESAQEEHFFSVPIEITFLVKVGKDSTTTLQTLFNETEALIITTLRDIDNYEDLSTDCYNFSLAFEGEKNIYFDEDNALGTLIFQCNFVF